MSTPGWVTSKRKIRVVGRMTTVQLENYAWDSFDAICGAANLSIHALASRIDARRSRDVGLTSALRLFILAYWRMIEALPGAPPHTIIDAALDQVIPPPACASAAMLMRCKERIAQNFTVRRAETARALMAEHGGFQDLGSAAREAWGPRPPWPPSEDALAGQALRDLVQPFNQ